MLAQQTSPEKYKLLSPYLKKNLISYFKSDFQNFKVKNDTCIVTF